MISKLEKTIINAALQLASRNQITFDDRMVKNERFSGNERGYYLSIDLKPYFDADLLSNRRYMVVIKIMDIYQPFTVVLHSESLIELEKWHNDQLSLDRKVDNIEFDISSVEKM
jgi:hypothetical protein